MIIIFSLFLKVLKLNFFNLDEKVDIFVYEVMKNGFVKILSIFSGCDCGEIELEVLFIGLLIDIVGKDVMDFFSLI